MEQLAVEFTPQPFALAECCPFALAADLSQKPLLQDGIVDLLAEFTKRDRLISFQTRTSEIHSALIKKRNLSFILAVSILVMGASLAESVASGCELQHYVGFTHESGHVLNKLLAVTLALKEQYAQSVVGAQRSHSVRWLVIFH